jgi:hypothetical protein
MKTMAVVTSCRIWVSGEDGLSVDAFSVTIIGMADRTFLNNPYFIPFPWGHFMDVLMTVFTLNVINEVGACIMLCPFLFVASMASDRLRMNSSPFGFHMSFDVGDIPVATIAGIGSMNRLGKFPLTDLGMATEAFGVVDTLITILPTLDDKLLHFLSRFRRLGHGRGFRTLFCRLGLGRPDEPGA